MSEENGNGLACKDNPIARGQQAMDNLAAGGASIAGILKDGFDAVNQRRRYLDAIFEDFDRFAANGDYIDAAATCPRKVVRLNIGGLARDIAAATHISNAHQSYLHAC